MISLGFRAHTGWAAAVALEGPVSQPTVIDRRRIQLSAGASPRFVFHAAAELALAAAERHVKRAREAVAESARSALAAYLKDLTPRKISACGVILGNQKLPTELADILGSHPLLHSAEGELFRQAIADAAEACKLRLVGIPAKQLRERAAATLGDEIDEGLAELGRRAGKPWAQDQKEASLAAWIALALR